MKTIYTAERIEQIIKDVPDRCFLNSDELHSIVDYCKANGMSDAEFRIAVNAIYYGTLATFAIGFRRGMNYQKRHNKRKAKIAAQTT